MQKANKFRFFVQNLTLLFVFLGAVNSIVLGNEPEDREAGEDLTDLMMQACDEEP